MNKNVFLIKFSEIYPIGKSKYAPGTIASLFTCVIFFYLSKYFQIEILILIFFITFFLSLLSIQIYIKLYGNKDHQSIVIDEFLGQYVALFSIPLLELENNIINISIIFLLFRFFDISKIRLRGIEKIPGTFGILFDDIIVNLYNTYNIFIFMVWKDINKESKVLIDKLKKLSFKISAAESCTGGLFSSAIVNNSGASEVFERSFVTYSNESKINILKIKKNIIKEFGAVSKQTAHHMSLSLTKNFNSELNRNYRNSWSKWRVKK